jgi:hypothetical protein
MVLEEIVKGVRPHPPDIRMYVGGEAPGGTDLGLTAQIPCCGRA